MLLIAVVGFLLAAFSIVATMLDYGILVVAIPVALIGGILVMMKPYYAIWFIAFFTQLDALMALLFASLPAIKLMTALAILGILITSHRIRFRDRWGGDEPILRLAALFCLSMLLSTFFIKDSELALWSLRRLGSLVVLLYLTVFLVRTMNQVKAIVFAVILSTTLSSGILIADYTMGTHLVASDHAALEAEYMGMSRNSGGSNYNPTTAATMTLTGTALALLLFMQGFGDWKWRTLSGVTVIFGSVGVVLSYARSSALVFGILLVWLLWKYRKHPRIPALLGSAVVLALVILPLIPASYWERMETLTNFDSDFTLWRRYGYNLIGVYLLASHPLLGVGPGQFQYHYLDPAFRYIPGRGLLSRQLHNMYLEVASEFGLIGVALFVGILFYGLWHLNKLRKNGPTAEVRMLAEALHFAYWGFLMVSVFVPNEYNKFTWLLPGIAVALYNASKLIPSRSGD